MARPDLNERRALESFEGTAAILAGSAMTAARYLLIRMRILYEVYTRGDSALRRAVEPAVEQMEELIEALERAQREQARGLAALQRARNRKNRRGGRRET